VAPKIIGAQLLLKQALKKFKPLNKALARPSLISISAAAQDS